MAFSTSKSLIISLANSTSQITSINNMQITPPLSLSFSLSWEEINRNAVLEFSVIVVMIILHYCQSEGSES